MNKATLRKLAEATARQGEVSDEFARSVLSRFARADLKAFLFYLRNELRRRVVTVRTAGIPADGVRTRIAGMFPDRTIDVREDARLGGGIELEYDDNVVQVSVRAMIEKTFRNLKEGL